MPNVHATESHRQRRGRAAAAHRGAAECGAAPRPRAATLRVAALAGVAALCGLLGSSLAWAAQTNVAISMTAPPAAPRILGPATFAARPGTPLVYSIAATGQKPLTFAVSGLPAGLTLAADSGAIGGTMPAAGTYPLSVTVTNGAGTATRTFALVAGDTLSPTPPLGWNSYDSFGGGVRETEVLQAAEAQKAQLQPFGWHYVVVDYLWFDGEQAIDANGRYLPSTSRFPSATGSLGFKPLADKIHAMGLGFGIHIMRGIPRKSVTANSPIAGSTFTASDAANTADACPWDRHMWGVRGDTAAGQGWYDSIFAQYAQWGIDFVKVDDMLNNQVSPNLYHQAEVDAIRKAIDKTGRSIVLSLSPGPMRTADAAHLNTTTNMWRMVNDFWDSNGLSTLAQVFSASNAWQAVTTLGVGHWPDADMLPLGYLGPRCPVHAAGPTALSQNQQVTVMSLWSILPSPLMFGGNVPALTTDATGPFTIALLTNEEVLAVNQDALGAHARRVSQQGTTEVWAKDVSGGRKAVALFNRGTQDAMVSATFSALGVSGTPLVRDLWRRADVVADMTAGLAVNVPHDGAVMYLLSPAGGGSGGQSGGGGRGSGGAGASGVAGSGGATGLGGAGAMTGSGGTGTGTGTGGGGPAGSGGGIQATGGAPGSGGLTGAGSGGAIGSGGTSMPPSAMNGSSGCACGVGGGPGDRGLGGPTGASLLACAAALTLARRRRRADTASRQGPTGLASCTWR